MMLKVVLPTPFLAILILPFAFQKDFLLALTNEK